MKRSDHDITDQTNALDEQRLLYYSAGWQIVEERIDDSWTSGHTTDRIVQHVWGLRYIDDLVLTRQDTTANGSYADKADLNHYALTDHQFSVVARVNQIGTLIDRIAYTPYGEARHQWYNDVNGDGEVNAADNTAASNASGNAIYQSNYNVDADFDRDGDVDSNDVALTGSTYYKAALPGGWIGLDGSAHTIGYCGYVFNQESGLYTVRFRHYDPVWGRWISRDPAGYMDSMSLYGYGWGSPVRGFDPLGLDWLDDLANWGAGAGDTLTFGLTKVIRRAIGIDDVVDYDSTAYAVGEWTGVAVGFIGGVGAVRGTITAVGQAIKAGGALVQFGVVALEGGGTIAVVIVNGQAIALTVEALVAAGYTAAQALQIIEMFSREGQLPAKSTPNSTGVRDNGKGQGQIREYGPDGKATKDYDFGHDHGAGDPHVHDWDWTVCPPRQPGRPLLPGE